MRKAVCVVFIRQGSILLVKKREVWILPGGKPEAGESDMDCLRRELGEELPAVKLSNIRYLDAFTGITPHQGDELLAEVYLAELEGDITPGAEISLAEWAKTPEEYDLSHITRQVVSSLRSKRLFIKRL